MDLQHEIPTSAAAAPAHETVERVVLFADMASYSRRIEEDEAATLEFMAGCFDTLRVLARRHGGTLVKTLGDGAMLLFDDPFNAIDYAVEFHRVISKLQLDSSEPYAFRIGLHKGDVLLRSGDAYGNTVNVAARLQTIAAPGQSVVSQVIYDAVHANAGLRFEALGAPSLKNIRDRVSVYRIVDMSLQGEASVTPVLTRIEVLKGVTVPNLRALSVDARVLLGYLALCPGHADSFERLAALLGGPDGASRVTACAAELSEQSIASTVPVTQYDGLLALDPVSVETDLEALLREVRVGRVPEVLTTDADWPHRILSGLDGAGTVFLGWRSVTRATWKRRMTQALERLLERTTPQEDDHEDAADAMLLLEPGNEVASEARIAARISHGDQGAAIAEYARLEQYLFETYGIAPGERIRSIVRDLRERGRHFFADAALPERTRPRRLLRIVVGKFEESSDVPAERLSAFRTDLVANLVRFRDWSVIDWADGAARAEERTVIDYCIKGAGTAQVGSPTLSLKLSEFLSGRAIWADRFDLASETWAEMQGEIIRQIAATIESYISADRLALALENAVNSATSHDAWLRGDRAMMRWTPEGTEEARGIFERILEADPDHTPSLFRLASISNVQHVIWPGRARRPADDAEADRFASRAVELDPMDARVQRTVAWTAAMNGSFARATMHMDLAASLNPNSPTTLASCAMGFAWFGEPEKADAALTRCLSIGRLLPEWGWAYVASAYFILGRLDEALNAAELGGDSIADTQGWIAVIQACRGDEEAAGAAFRKFLRSVTSSWSGDAAVTAQSAADWFATAYPLRRTSDRARLADAIHTARRAA